jgi:hypothetical protein
MLKNHKEMFGEPPWLLWLDRTTSHPEPDMTPELDLDGIKKHQSLMGAPLWSASNATRFDIAVHAIELD